jgi:hypothetical protein
MAEVGWAFGAIGEATVFLDYFGDLSDPRRSGKVTYPLAEVLLLSLLGGADSFVDIARFGQKKLDLLRRFLPFCDGTPSHDQLGDIFATLDAEQFQRCFVACYRKDLRRGAAADMSIFDAPEGRIPTGVPDIVRAVSSPKRFR